MKKCLCGKKFRPEADHHYLCDDCWQEKGCFADYDSIGIPVSRLINGKWTREELEMVADSPAFRAFWEECLDELDYKFRAKYLLKLAERYVK